MFATANHTQRRSCTLNGPGTVFAFGSFPVEGGRAMGGRHVCRGCTPGHADARWPSSRGGGGRGRDCRGSRAGCGAGGVGRVRPKQIARGGLQNASQGATGRLGGSFLLTLIPVLTTSKTHRYTNHSHTGATTHSHSNIARVHFQPKRQDCERQAQPEAVALAWPPLDGAWPGATANRWAIVRHPLAPWCRAWRTPRTDPWRAPLREERAIKGKTTQPHHSQPTTWMMCKR